MRKLISILTAMVIMINLAAVNAQGFTDMPSGKKGEALEAAAKNGLLVGNDGKIMPETPLTRGQVAVILGKVFDPVSTSDISRFTDVKPTDWYYNGLKQVVGMKILAGSGNKIMPEKSISREEMYTIIASTFGFKSDRSGDADDYNDLAEVANWAKPAVLALAEADLILEGDSILPKQTVSRAEFAVLMHSLIKNHLNTNSLQTDVSGGLLIKKPGTIISNIKIDGNVFIADSVGLGNVTFDNVEIDGNLVIRSASGKESVILKGNTQVDKILVLAEEQTATPATATPATTAATTPATTAATTTPATTAATTTPATTAATTTPATTAATTTAGTTSPTTPETTAATTPETTPETTPVTSDSSFADEVLRLTNIEREKAGVPALTQATHLQSYVDLRADEITQKFSHTRPDGTSFYSGISGYRSVGENIAAGHRSPEQVVKAWMNSEGHRRNILNPDFKQLAVGYKNNAWVQIFFTPMN